MENTDLPKFPCPVCQNCDHDLRADVLELSENIVQNTKDAFQGLLDGMEADGDGGPQFVEAVQDLASVRRQLATVIEAISDIAVIKAATAE